MQSRLALDGRKSTFAAYCFRFKDDTCGQDGTAPIVKSYVFVENNHIMKESLCSWLPANPSETKCGGYTQQRDHFFFKAKLI